MNKLHKLAFLALLFSFFMVMDANAQGFNAKYRYWSYGATLNVMNYVGDVDPGPSIISPGVRFTKYNLGAVVMRRLGSRVSLRGTFSFGKIGGDDDKNNPNYSTKGGDIYRKARNLSFKNNIYELKGDVVIDLIEHRAKYQKRPDFVPYLFAGLAYFHHNPKAEYAGRVVELRDYNTEGQGLLPGAPKQYSLHQIAIPAGLGLRYKISKQLDLAFEIGWRFTFTDYLDDMGGVYVDKQALYAAKGGGQDGIDAVLLSDRSWETFPDPQFDAVTTSYSVQLDPNDPATTYTFRYVGGGDKGDRRAKDTERNDAYIITGLHLMYIIPTKVICPKFR